MPHARYAAVVSAKAPRIRTFCSRLVSAERLFNWAVNVKKNFSGEGGMQVLLNLKSAIAARQTRQVDLAISLKIAPSLLSEIVNGRRQADASLRARIAQAL